MNVFVLRNQLKKLIVKIQTANHFISIRIQIQITFDKAIANTSSWTLANVQARFTFKINGVSQTITYAAQPTSTTITLQTSATIVYGDVVSVSYSVPGSAPYLQDTEAHNSASFTDFKVVNNVVFVDTYS